MDDVRAVMDAIGSQRAVLTGFSEGSPMSILFAATYPERVSHLILIGGFARPIPFRRCVRSLRYRDGRSMGHRPVDEDV